MKKDKESEFKNEIRKLPIAELKKLEQEWVEEARKTRFEEILGSIDSATKKKAIRHRIAMIKTILHEYELGIRERREEKIVYIDKKFGHEYQL